MSPPPLRLCETLELLSQQCSARNCNKEEPMKAIIWIWTAVGLAPAVFLLAQWRSYAVFQQMAKQIRGNVHTSVYRASLGRWSMECFPRVWTFALLAAGIAAIVVSLIFLMHVPKTDNAL
jgi:hypothetical protein